MYPLRDISHAPKRSYSFWDIWLANSKRASPLKSLRDLGVRSQESGVLFERGHRSKALITSEPEAPRGSFTSQPAPDLLRSEIVFSWEYSPARSGTGRRRRHAPGVLANPYLGS